MSGAVRGALRSDAFSLPGGDTAVLLIHGFTGEPAHMQPCAQLLAGKGYTVRAMRIPGHGAGIEDIVDSQGWTQWLAAARSETLELLSRHRKVVVLGLSMGGALAVLMGEELPVDGVIAAAPAMKVVNRWAPLAPWLSPLLPRYMTTSGGMPLRRVGDVLTLGRLARRQLDRLRCPILIVQARGDGTVTADGPDIIVKGSVNCTDKEIVWLDSDRHTCTDADILPLFSHKVEAFMEMIDALDPID